MNMFIKLLFLILLVSTAACTNAIQVEETCDPSHMLLTHNKLMRYHQQLGSIIVDDEEFSFVGDSAFIAQSETWIVGLEEYIKYLSVCDCSSKEIQSQRQESLKLMKEIQSDLYWADGVAKGIY